MSWSDWPLLGLVGQPESILYKQSAPWQIYKTLYLFFSMQECILSFLQYAGMIALHGGWDTHSSALGLQTQQSQFKGSRRGSGVVT
jgi:hypothetical protein